MKLSLKIKMVILFFLFSSIVSIGTSITMYKMAEANFINELRERLENITHIGSNTIDMKNYKNILSKLSPKANKGVFNDIDSQKEIFMDGEKLYDFELGKGYRQLIDELEYIRQAEPELILYVYILVPTEKEDVVRFIADADTTVEIIENEIARGERLEEDVHFSLRYEIEDQPITIQAVQQESNISTTSFVYDETYDVHSLMGFAPIYDEEGTYLGTIGVDISSDNADKVLSSLIFVTIIILVVSILISLVCIYIIASRLIKPMKTLTQCIQRIEEGKLYTRVNIKNNDEIGILSNSINNLTERFSKIISSIRQSAQGFVSATNEINDGNQHLSERTSHRASNFEETTASIYEVSSAISENTENSVQAKGLTEEVMSSMDKLEESSNKMKEIIQVITDIAFQTNLLALNASVEAARAGEHGKGFEVVAKEVKELSEKSSAQAKEIVQIVEESIDKINHNVSQINNIVNLVNKISMLSTEQNKQIKQISVAIDELSEGTQQDATLVEESASASEEISQRARQLEKLVSYFKTEERNKTASRQLTGN